MICVKCRAEVPDAPYCCQCGAKQQRTRTPKKRGNGQGTVYKLKNGKYRATVVLGFYKDENGKLKRKTRSASFTKAKDAVAALPRLMSEPAADAKKKQNITLRELYDRWFPTHRAGKSTMDCYRAAFKYFSPLWCSTMADIDVDDLQECIDGCGKGKRTQENMRAVCGLVYKYGVPRNAIPNNLNLAEFLVVSGEKAAHRESFTDEQIERLKKGIGTVPYADYVYCWIYLGFRPSEALALTVDRYDAGRQCFVGGGKTQAGTNRIVTISPRIQAYIRQIIAGRSEGYVFCDAEGAQLKLKSFTEDCFYPALEGCGIENPYVEIAGGVKRHRYTPHTCRHTFSTLMKRVDAPSKDKLELIGHTSEEMLRYYQDVNIDDLKKITDRL